MDKVAASAADAVADLRDGATIVFGGFGVMQGWPNSLLLALRDRGVRDLTLVFNTPGVGPWSAQILAEAGLVRRIVASFVAYPTRVTPIETLVRQGRIDVELVPQGTLAERLRAGGAGIAAFWTPTGVGTSVAVGKERRTFEGREYVLEHAIRADVACLRAARADRHGNLLFRRAARNFHPVCAMAARCTIAEVDEIVEPGHLDGEAVVTPGIWVDRVVRTSHPLDVGEVRELTRRHGRVVEQAPRPGLGGLPPDLMARRAALCLQPGEYVNLGLGLPTLVSSHLAPEDGVVLHAENGMLGYGPLVDDGPVDVDLYNASGQLVHMLPGGSVFDSATAHAMARGGRISTVILGAFEVSERGDLANWNVPSTGKGGIGGAMDLVSGGARVIVLTFQTTRAGASKLVPSCRYPLTAPGCVREVVTDLGYLTIEPEGFILREIAPGVTLDTVRAHTAGRLLVPLDLRAMTFG